MTAHRPSDEPFFEPPTPLPEEEEEEWEEQRKPWHAPAPNVLGGFVPLDLRLAKTDDVLIIVRSVTAYENGFEFQVDIRFRDWEVREKLGDFHGFGGHRRFLRGSSRELPDEVFRFGVQFPDGSKATNVRPRYGDLDDEPTPPMLMERGGGGGGSDWRQGYWVWPLPPSEPFHFVCEWPAAGIPLTRIEVDGALIVQGSTRTEELWPPEPPSRQVRMSVGEWFGSAIAAEATDEEEEED